MAIRDSNFTLFGSTTSKTVAITVVSGDVIVVMTVASDGPTTINLPTDDDGGNAIYTAIRLDQDVAGPTIDLRCFWTTTTVTGTLTITQTLSAASFGFVTAISLSGRNTGSPISDSDGADQPNETGTDSIATPTLTVAQGDDLLAITALAGFGGTTVSAGTGFTNLEALDDNGLTGRLEGWANLSAGSQAGTFTPGTGGTAWVVQAVAIAAAAGSASASISPSISASPSASASAPAFLIVGRTVLDYGGD